MPSNTVYACIRCCIAWKAGPTFCTRCGVTARWMGSKWRAPKQSNKAAWKMIRNGNPWWDEKALAKSERVQWNIANEIRWAWEKLKIQRKPGSKLK